MDTIIRQNQIFSQDTIDFFTPIDSILTIIRRILIFFLILLGCRVLR